MGLTVTRRVMTVNHVILVSANTFDLTASSAPVNLANLRIGPSFMKGFYWGFRRFDKNQFTTKIAYKISKQLNQSICLDLIHY